MGKAEAKFANTAKRMDDAMVELLEEKLFQAITVTDICKAAGVHRSTFYSHYDHTLDLLKEVREQTMREFQASFSHLPRQGAFRDRAYLDTYLKFVEEHKQLFKVFLENVSLFDGFEILLGFESEMKGASTAKGSRKNGRSLYKLLYTASGITSIVSYWLESGCMESRSELADIILECTDQR